MTDKTRNLQYIFKIGDVEYTLSKYCQEKGISYHRMWHLLKGPISLMRADLFPHLANLYKIYKVDGQSQTRKEI